MPLVNELTLLLIDTAFQSVGAILLALVLTGLIRSGRWHDPLAELEFGGGGPTLVHVAVVLATFYALLVLGVRSVGIDPEAARVSGSHEWHVGRCVEDGAKLIACALVVFLLHRYPSFGAPRRRLAPLRLVLVSVVTTLIILPVSYLQLEMGKIVWRWLDPGAVQPVHVVLQALERSEWGIWGSVHLSVAALVIVPLVEELFFRGLLLQALWRQLGHAWLAIALSGVAFGLIHNPQPQDVLPLITMGVILGYVRMRYQSLAVCVGAHALFNARTVVLVLLNPELSRSGW